MAANGSFLVEYRTANPPDFIAPHTHIQRGTAHYEGGFVTPCLIHTFHGADEDRVNTALGWAHRTTTSPIFLKVLGINDKRQDPNNPRLVILTEDIASTFQAWILNLNSSMQQVYRGTHVSSELAAKLRLLFTIMADLSGHVHGAINSDNIFLVVDGKIKLGMTCDTPESTDIEQLDVMLRGIGGLNPFPTDLDYLLQSLTSGTCWTNQFPAWRDNNLKFAVASPALMSAKEDLQKRESTHYRINRLRAEQPPLHSLVELELRTRLQAIYPNPSGGALIADWRIPLWAIPQLDPLYPLNNAFMYSRYHPQDPFAFSRYGRHFKVHKPQHWSDEDAVTGLNYALYGFSFIVHEVLSGYGIEVD